MTDLSWNLLEIAFCETDASKVEQEVFSIYEQATGRKLYPGNPERLFCESMAFIIALQRTIIDDSAKQNLLAYARGDFLDHLGALTDTARLNATAARTTVRFSIDEPLAFAVTIPEGTRITPDDELYFAALESVDIPAGATYVEVTAECLETGAAGNGFVAGQINQLVDPIAYIESTVNTTISLGGADVETDDNYRQRIHLSPEKYSVAGPGGAYDYWAKSAHQDIIDVAVYSPEPGVVDVRPLLTGGEIPDREVLDLVRTALDPEKVIPLTDTCQVLAPEVVTYDLNVTYWILKSNASISAQIQTRVNAAVETYRLWQRTKVGRDINPSHLIYLVQAAGAKRVQVAAPEFQALEPWQAARETGITVTYGGMEDV